MQRTPFVKEYIEIPEKGQGPRTLTRVTGYWTPKGLTYRGKRIVSGIFVNVTGLTEKGKQEAFELAKEELGEKGEGLDLYEIIEPEPKPLIEREVTLIESR